MRDPGQGPPGPPTGAACWSVAPGAFERGQNGSWRPPACDWGRAWQAARNACPAPVAVERIGPKAGMACRGSGSGRALYTGQKGPGGASALYCPGLPFTAGRQACWGSGLQDVAFPKGGRSLGSGGPGPDTTGDFRVRHPAARAGGRGGLPRSGPAQTAAIRGPADLFGP